MENNREHKIDETLQQWFLDVKELILDHKYVIMGVGLLMFVALVCITIFNSELRTFLFVTDKGRFQWIGLSAAAAMVGLFINAVWNRKRIRADVVSKYRVQVMQDNQKLVAKLVTVVNSEIELIDQMIYTRTTGPANDDRVQKYNQYLDTYTEQIFLEGEIVQTLKFSLLNGDEYKSVFTSLKDVQKDTEKYADAGFDYIYNANKEEKQIINENMKTLKMNLYGTNDEIGKIDVFAQKCDNYFHDQWEIIEIGK